jgi:serine phosphatase RsbU (regulator of sigma subunit)
LANFGMLGFLEEAQMGEDILELHSGDIIIGHTDGIYEGSDRGAELALLGELGPVIDADPKIIAAAVEQWALKKNGRAFSDDATIAVLRIGEAVS